ncbi:MAG: hypothetical protein AAF446_08890 [Pseudomonadota bacterium]
MTQKLRSVLFLAVVIMTGCATVDSPGPASDDFRLTQAAQADQIARLMTGRYIGLPMSASAEPSSGLIRLDIEIDPGSSATQAVVRMRQSDPGATAPREFLLAFRPEAVSTEPVLPNRLQGEFAPLNASGQPVRSCPMDVMVFADGFVAETRTINCRFNSVDGEVALKKEIAHDGQRLVIGDRLEVADTGQPVGTDQIIQFDRIQTYTGWAGVRDSADADWRLAGEFALESSGGRFVPQDAGGMDLNIAIELAPYRWNVDEPSVLRLRAFDLESGQILGQSWANANASQIGLALPNLQVGLRLQSAIR